MRDGIGRLWEVIEVTVDQNKVLRLRVIQNAAQDGKMGVEEQYDVVEGVQ